MDWMADQVFPDGQWWFVSVFHEVADELFGVVSGAAKWSRG